MTIDDLMNALIGDVVRDMFADLVGPSALEVLDNRSKGKRQQLSSQ